MDRMEILRMALGASKDAREALALANQMAAFVRGTPVDDAPVVVPASVQELKARARCRWTDDERLRAADMIDAGKDLAAVAQSVGRSLTAIEKAWLDGVIPAQRQYVPRRQRNKAASQ